MEDFESEKIAKNLLNTVINEVERSHMKTQEILNKISNSLKENMLLHEIKLEPSTSYNEGNIPEHDYFDVGNSGIVTKKLKEPFIYMDKNIIGFTIVDKYVYGEENKTRKKYDVTLYYQEE